MGTSDTNTLGTSYVNARASMHYVARCLRRGFAPLIEVSPYGRALSVQCNVEPYDLDDIELGERASYVNRGLACDGLSPCPTCLNGDSHA
jgi:hypothetical protein